MLKGARVLLTSAVLITWATSACAFDARLAWRPVAAAAGYMVHVRYNGGKLQPPLFVGSQAPGKDGLVHVVVTGVRVAKRATFSVRAYDSDERLGPASNEITLAYPQIAAVIDSDGDGFTDAEEDVNLDGIVQAWETDPHDAASAIINGCRGKTNGSRCDDGVACTYGDRCAAGVCRGVASCSGERVCSLDRGACIGFGSNDAVWIAPANDPTAVFSGTMLVANQYAGGRDQDPNADSIATKLVSVQSGASDYQGGSGDQVDYEVTLDRSGSWYLWGRFYYPDPNTAGSNSFFAAVDDGDPLRFGNKTDVFRTWHWDGDGNVEKGDPTPLALGYLKAGAHTLKIEKREAGAKPPQLDVLVLTTDASYVPDDKDAHMAFGRCGDGEVGLDEECDDGDANGDPSLTRCQTDCSWPSICGDADHDGVVRAGDSWRVQWAAVHAEVSCPYWRCDVNADGSVSVTDALLILRASVGRAAALNCAKF